MLSDKTLVKKVSYIFCSAKPLIFVLLNRSTIKLKTSYKTISEKQRKLEARSLRAPDGWACGCE